MKLSPLFIFLLLLIVLVISIITLKNPIIPVNKGEKEGFVQFQADKANQTEVVIPSYSSRKIVKLYDNIFIDRKNANMVEVDSKEFIGNLNVTPVQGNVDLSGTSIVKMYIQTRDGVYISRDVSGTAVVECDESKISIITSSYKTIPYYTTKCATTGQYQQFYIPWNTDTYIHAMQLSASPTDPNKSRFTAGHLYTYYIPSTSTENMKVSMYTNKPINIGTPLRADVSPNNNKMVIEPLYSLSNKVYQLSSDIKFDIKNANLIVNKTGSSILVYNRTGSSPKEYTSIPNTLDSKVETNVQFSPWIINNEDNTIQILYVQYIGNTLVVLFKKDEAQRFVILNMARFTQMGVDTGTDSDQVSNNAKDIDVDGKKNGDSNDSDYYKWYWYWKTSTADPGMTGKYSNDYLLKTQIVPPVCPACPSAGCNSGGGDSGSGGNVLSNTVNATGNAISKTVDTAGNAISKTVDTAGNAISKTVDTTSNLLTSGATGASNLLTSGATGATNLLTSGATGATNLLTSGISGTADLLKSGASGTVGLLKDAGAGTANIVNNLATPGYGQGQGQGQGYGQGQGQGQGVSPPGYSQGNPPIDNYSYYGALPPKGSSYIPITADFSAFKK